MARIHDMASEGHPSLAPHLPQTAAKSATDNPDLVKASHTYDKRVAKPGGGYNYIYAKDAHHHAKKEAHHRDMAKISYHDAPNSLTALEGLPEGTSFKEARSHHDEMSESHRQSKISFAGEHGGKVLGTTRRDGHEMTIEEHGEHPTKEGKTRISARTEIPHVHKTPHIVRYDQKVMVKDSHNTDTGMVTYTEHDPESHLIDTDQRLRDGGFRTSYTQDRRTPGKFEVTGSPILRAGGELPHTINDPHHGELKVLSHNSDSGKTIYSVGGKIPMAKSDFGIKYKTSIAQTYQGENNE
jgi:hypothetical protein